MAGSFSWWTRIQDSVLYCTLRLLAFLMVTTEGSYIEKMELQADSGIWQNMATRINCFSACSKTYSRRLCKLLGIDVSPAMWYSGEIDIHCLKMLHSKILFSFSSQQFSLIFTYICNVRALELPFLEVLYTCNFLWDRLD